MPATVALQSGKGVRGVPGETMKSGDMAAFALKILIVMDSAFNADLIGRLLRKGGIAIDAHRVYDEESMRAALAPPAFPPDAILCEDVLQRFDCLSAMAVGRELCPQVPIIFISGGQGEELAIECIKGGAQDFVPMSNLARLPRALERAVREARDSAQARKLRRDNAVGDHYYAQLVDQACECVISVNLDGVVRSWNRAAESLYGFSAAEAVGTSLRQLHLAHVSEEDFNILLGRIRSGATYTVDSLRRRRSGQMVRVFSSHSPLSDDNGEHIGQVTISRVPGRQEQTDVRPLSPAGMAFGAEACVESGGGAAGAGVVVQLGSRR